MKNRRKKRRRRKMKGRNGAAGKRRRKTKKHLNRSILILLSYSKTWSLKSKKESLFVSLEMLALARVVSFQLSLEI